MLGVCRVFDEPSGPLDGRCAPWCCECAAAAAADVLIGGGFGLFLCGVVVWDLLFVVVILLVIELVLELVVEAEVVVVGGAVGVVVVVLVVDDWTLVGEPTGVQRDDDADLSEQPLGDRCRWPLALRWLGSVAKSDMVMVLLFTSQLLGEVGGEVEVGDADAELELATELQLPVLRDKSVGSFSPFELAAEAAWWW